METSFIFKEFFVRSIESDCYDFRTSNRFIDDDERENYIFNSSINGIEQSDLIFLIGTNPRYEATILNARIRKSFVNNNTKVISINDIGNLTYPYESLDGQTKTLKDILENKHELSNILKSSKKPMIIIGESFFNLKSSKNIFYLIKDYLKSNFKFDNEWNPLNILSTDASTVGNIDLGVFNNKLGNNITLEKLQNNELELLFLIGQDNLNINKKNEFIIYIGSHGDRGAEVADIILPGAAYTEQTAHYTNLEGKVQKAYKASYPPGEAKEDWQIINELAETMNNRKLFNDKDELISSMINFINLKNKNSVSETKNLDKDNFEDEILKIEIKDYYFSNVVARASKTMIDCNNSKINFKYTGTEG